MALEFRIYLLLSTFIDDEVSHLKTITFFSLLFVFNEIPYQAKLNEHIL